MSSYFLYHSALTPKFNNTLTLHFSGAFTSERMSSSSLYKSPYLKLNKLPKSHKSQEEEGGEEIPWV